jgi:alpha-L-fucosidase
MKKLKINLTLLFLLSISIMQVEGQSSISSNSQMQWWKDARFGMFIHWGVYSVPAGIWKGKEIPGIGEQIMGFAKIPAVEYRELTKQFNPVKFDAKTWVKIAKNAGMKYVVITAKHHDGFAMFKSEASKYNIVDATPFKRDPIKELADECAKQGLKMCFYYSHDKDWNEPGGSGNHWDNFQKKMERQNYYETKVKPQLTELLTNYGPIGLIWFDTPSTITTRQAAELKALVRKLQPECIISGRLGGGVQTDYQSSGDHVVPAGVIPGYWEVPSTLNNTWGYKQQDNNWKKPSQIIPLLFDIVSKGGNYLLNVGPTSEGVIPLEAVNVLAEVGKWIKINGKAIRGTEASPYKAEFDWGGITTRGKKMYLGFIDWPKNGEFYLDGLKTIVKKVYLLSDTSRDELNFTQEFNTPLVQQRLKINLPRTAPDPNVSVVVVELNNYPEVNEIPTQQVAGNIFMPACLGNPVKNGKPAPLTLLGRGGGISKWTDEDISMVWEFKVKTPGNYKLDLITNETGRHVNIVWQSGHVVNVACNGQKQQVVITADKKEYNPHGIYWKRIHTYGKTITFNKPGVYSITVDPVEIKKDEVPSRFYGFTLSGVRLIKEK